MSVKVFNTRIQLKNDTAEHWGSAGSLVLLPGEFAWDSTNNNFKVGDGTKAWSALPYAIGASVLSGYTAITGSVGDVTNTDSLNTAIAKLQKQIKDEAAAGVRSIGGTTGTVTLGNGLQATGTTDGSISVKVDSTNANGLSVGPNGLALATVVASTSDTGGSNGVMTAAQAEKLAGIATGAQVNVLEGVQVNGSDLTVDANKKVNVTVAEGTANGTIKVNGSDVAVHGLGSAAYEDASAFEAAFTDGSHTVATMGSYTQGTGEIATQKIEFFDGIQSGGVLGTAASASETLYFKSAVTAANPIVTNSDLSGIVGAMVYKGVVDTTTNTLPTTGVQPGWTYVVSKAGTYAGVACEVGDMIIAKDNTPTWNVISGENQVVNSQATITAGDGNYTTIATVDGETITAKVSVTGSAGETIASESDGVVTLSKTITQSTGAGTIDIDGASTNQITLAKVATTGDAEDITVDSANYGGTSTVTTAQAALDNLATAVGNINTAIADLDATVDADVTSGEGVPHVTQSEPSVDFTVLNSVSQTDGKLTGGTAYNLKKVAATANVNDLIQANNDCLIFNCGSATTVTNQYPESNS